jgi:hypothetical protein
MKEHAFFIEAALASKYKNLRGKARVFMHKFDGLLDEALAVSTGAIGPDAGASDEIVTPYTLNAELASGFFTGIPVNTEITQKEIAMTYNIRMTFLPKLEEKINVINQKAIILTAALVNYKKRLFSDVLASRVYISMYPSLLIHMIEEAKQYIGVLQMLQKYEHPYEAHNILEQERFWNDIMCRHMEYIKGSLDPIGRETIEICDKLSKEFWINSQRAKNAESEEVFTHELVNGSIDLMRETTDFMGKWTQELLKCKIHASVLPIVADHTFREANHYYRLLRMFQKMK